MKKNLMVLVVAALIASPIFAEDGGNQTPKVEATKLETVKEWAKWAATPAAFVVGSSEAFINASKDSKTPKTEIATAWFNRTARVTLVTLIATKAYSVFAADSEDCEYDYNN